MESNEDLQPNEAELRSNGVNGTQNVPMSPVSWKQPPAMRKRRTTNSVELDDYFVSLCSQINTNTTVFLTAY